MPKNLLEESVIKLNIKMSPEEWVCSEYLSGKSCNQISQEIFSKTAVRITPKGIAYFIKKHNLMRQKKDSLALSIVSGRMNYPSRGKRFVRSYI
jgi:hypothetical protein